MRAARTAIEVALREVRVRGRGRAWWGSTLLLAILASAAVLLPSLIEGSDDDAPDLADGEQLEVGLIGTADEIVEAALAVTEERVRRPVTVSEVTDAATASELVREEDLRLVIDASGARPEIIARAPTFLGGSDDLAALVSDTIARIEAGVERGLSVDDAAAALDVEPVTIVEAVEGDPVEEARRGGLAYAGLFFMYTTLIIYGTWIVNGIIEEKSSRVVEVLLATVRPRELLAGKVLGLGLLGIAQVLAILLPAVLLSAVVGDALIPRAAIGAVVGIVGWWIIGFLLFGAMLSMTGSLVQRPEDAQAAVFPVVAVILVGMFASMTALSSPNDLIPTVASFVPFTAPLVMVVRTTLGAAEWWEVLLAALSIVVGAAAMSLAAGRIYTGAILRTGGRVKLREAWRAQGV